MKIIDKIKKEWKTFSKFDILYAIVLTQLGLGLINLICSFTGFYNNWFIGFFGWLYGMVLYVKFRDILDGMFGVKR